MYIYICAYVCACVCARLSLYIDLFYTFPCFGRLIMAISI